jgi:hypothetical protein
MLRKKSKFILS